MKCRLIISFVLGLAIMNIFHADSAFGKSKNWTITERQQALSAKVDKGQKSNELTKKEADKLRSRLDDLNKEIEKCKSKNGGKLSYKDEGKIEKKLNSISVDLDKEELDKRVQAR